MSDPKSPAEILAERSPAWREILKPLTQAETKDAALAEAENVAAEQVRRYKDKQAKVDGAYQIERWETFENYREAAQYIRDGIRALRGLPATEDE